MKKTFILVIKPLFQKPKPLKKKTFIFENQLTACFKDFKNKNYP